MKKEGGCACGRVRYEMHGEFTGVVSCHCTTCQKLHGNYNPMVIIDKDKLTITNDEGLEWYTTSPEKDRGFCKKCGSAIFMRQTKGPKMLISAGSLDDSSGLKNIKNVFTEEAGEYYTMPESA